MDFIDTLKEWRQLAIDNGFATTEYLRGFDFAVTAILITQHRHTMEAEA